MEAQRTYDIITDVQTKNGLAIIDNRTNKIVARGILPHAGKSAWKLARELRDSMNKNPMPANEAAS